MEVVDEGDVKVKLARNNNKSLNGWGILSNR